CDMVAGAKIWMWLEEQENGTVTLYATQRATYQCRSYQKQPDGSYADPHPRTTQRTLAAGQKEELLLGRGPHLIVALEADGEEVHPKWKNMGVDIRGGVEVASDVTSYDPWPHLISSKSEPGPNIVAFIKNGTMS